MLTSVAMCPLSTVCVSVFLYADDILLIVPSVSGLQTLVNICETELINIDMSINPKKSVCIRFGQRFNAHCEHITSVSGMKFEWVDNCRYLGVFFVSGRQFRCSFDNAKGLLFNSLILFSARLGLLHPRMSLLTCYVPNVFQFYFME